MTSLATDEAPVDVWADVVGQPETVAALRAGLENPVHAWLFVGPSGSGTRPAARAFAAELLARVEEDPELADRHRRLALADAHPDVMVVERAGAQISVGQAEDIVRKASRSPVEGARKVIVLDEFHFVIGPAAGMLLKTIEEPPDGTFFIVLAENVPPELVTIASRCARVDFAPLTPTAVQAGLIASGVSAERAAEVAAVAHGDLDRARLLAEDERLALRLGLWRSVPTRLDGTGHVAAGLVDEVRACIDDAAAPLAAVHAREVVELDEQVARYGLKRSGVKELEDRHKREQRRLRTDELRLGLTELARRYRDGLIETSDAGPLLEAVGLLHKTIEALIRNPVEELLLQALFVRLPRVT